MTVIVYRHEEYNKFLVTVENGFEVKEIILYDITVSELGEFIKELTK